MHANFKHDSIVKFQYIGSHMSHHSKLIDTEAWCRNLITEIAEGWIEFLTNGSEALIDDTML